MASTESKYKKMQGDTDPSSSQLIYPIDLATDDSYIPHVVIFEPNTLIGSKMQQKGTLSAPSNKISGSYGTEIAMYTAENSGSTRSKKGFSDFGAEQSNITYKKSGESIVLPMPAQFVQNYTTMWQSTELGAIGRGLDYMNSMKEHDYKTLGSQTGDAIKQSLAGAVQGLGISNMKDYLEIATGMSVNNFAEVLFKGVANRTLPFLYTFAPRNAKEAAVVQRIIHRFKFHQLPEDKYDGGNNSYLLHPSTFDISFIDLALGGNMKHIGKMSTCALTNLSVNGTPNGEYAALTGSGGFPICQLELSFTELTSLTKSNMADAENSS